MWPGCEWGKGAEKLDNDCGSDRGVAGAQSSTLSHVKVARRKKYQQEITAASILHKLN